MGLQHVWYNALPYETSSTSQSSSFHHHYSTLIGSTRLLTLYSTLHCFVIFTRNYLERPYLYCSFWLFSSATHRLITNLLRTAVPIDNEGNLIRRHNKWGVAHWGEISIGTKSQRERCCVSRCKVCFCSNSSILNRSPMGTFVPIIGTLSIFLMPNFPLNVWSSNVLFWLIMLTAPRMHPFLVKCVF